MTEDRTEHRHQVEIQGRYRIGTGLAKDVAVSDLSAQGCRFYDRFSNLTVGDFISIRIGNIGPIDAQVRWTRRFHAGLQFASPLHPSVLAHMVPTIQDSMTLESNSKRRQESIEAADTSGGTETDQQFFDLRVRPPSWHDLRAVFESSSKPLPIANYADALDFFYRLLEWLTETDDCVEPRPRD